MLHGVVRSRRKQFRLSMQCHVSTDGQQADYEYTQVKFLIKIDLFPPNQLGGV